MGAALLSRFDLVFVLLDSPDDSHDKKLSEHIMRLHAAAAAGTGDRGANQVRVYSVVYTLVNSSLCVPVYAVERAT
jgi:DNA replicative helicase MCM subunit Mcm2 (Cdc46/Mcm family)